MVERNALFFYLDDYNEEFPEWYMDDLGHLSVETAQRMLVYAQSMLDRPSEIVALEGQWEDWWPLAAVFIEVYVPGLEEYRQLAPVTFESADALSPADVRYLQEVKTELSGYIAARHRGDRYTYWPSRGGSMP